MHVRKFAILVVLVASVALAQTSIPAVPAETGESAPAATVADSTTLEIIKSQKAVYPATAVRDGIQGQVWLQLLVSEAGDVERVEVISGDPILAKAAVSASKKNKYKPFLKNGKAVKATTKVPYDFYFTSKLKAGEFKTTQEPAPSAVSTPSSPSGAPEVPEVPELLRVEQGVSKGSLIHKIAPVYPAIAKQNHIEGTVLLNAVIGKDGRITSLTPISGPKELIPAAIGAVQQWRYKPFMLKGELVEINTQITVNFTVVSVVAVSPVTFLYAQESPGGLPGLCRTFLNDYLRTRALCFLL